MFLFLLDFYINPFNIRLMDEFVTFYDILEIKKDASSAEIKAAYHALAKKYHPDISTTDNQQEFEEKFKKINEAYSTLSEAK